MLRGRNGFFLIALLALLQCMAPLLHAHAFGVGQGEGVHLHDVIAAYPGDFDSVQAICEEAPAIGMAQEHRQDGALLLAASQTPALLPAFPAVPGQVARAPFSSHEAPSSGRRDVRLFPFPQAPPLPLM